MLLVEAKSYGRQQKLNVISIITATEIQSHEHPFSRCSLFYRHLFFDLFTWQCRRTVCYRTGGRLFRQENVAHGVIHGGAAITLLFVAEYYDIIDITDEKLQHAASAATEAAKNSGGFLVDRLTSITSKGASGVGGFFVGFKLG